MQSSLLYKPITQIHLDGKILLNYRTGNSSIKEENLDKNHELWNSVLTERYILHI